MILVPLLLVALSQTQTPAGAEPGALTRLSGKVVGSDDRPLQGVEVRLSGLGKADGILPVLSRARTDGEGRFRVEVPSEKDKNRVNLPLTVWAYRPGSSLVGQSFTRQNPPEGNSVTLKLGASAGADLKVLGPDGKPVAGARVTPAMVRIPGGLPPVSGFPPPDELSTLVAGETDAGGRCRVAGMPHEGLISLRVEAPGFGRQGGELGTDAAGDRTFILAPVGKVNGRVVGDDPASARGLTVRAFTSPEGPRGARIFGEGETKADGEGRFTFPAIAAGRLAVNVVLPAGTALSPKLPEGRKVEPGQTTGVVEIVLRSPGRLREVTGRVADRRGKPVAGATVFQSGDAPARTQAETDGEGRFALAGVSGGRTFLLVRAAGFRFGGLAVGPKDGGVTVTLTRDGDDPADQRATLPPPMPRAEELAMARRVLDPYLVRALKGGGESEKVQVIEALARVEPARALELIEGKTFAVPFLNDMLRMRVATGLRDDAPDEAMAVVESIGDPGARAMGLIAESDALPAPAKAKKLDVLGRALIDARGAKDPTFKLLTMGQVGERYLDLGETERGRALLREGEKVAGELPNAAFAGYARGAFAEELAQIDLPAALALTKALSDPREFDRHHGNIAHELAGRDPAAAERVLGMVRDPFQRDQYAVRAVYRMARVDSPRAARIARAIGDTALRGFGLGMVALGLAEAGQSAEAASVLAEAFDSLEKTAAPGAATASRLYHPGAVAAVLLPVAERVDRRLVPESIWRVLAMRPPKPAVETAFDPGQDTDIQLALLLARYDRALARSLLDPLVGPDAPPWVRVVGRGLPFVAAAVIDPRWAVELVEALPDDPDVKAHGTMNSARLAVAKVLSRHGEGRWRYLQNQHLHLWVPDIEDHAPDL